MRRSALFVTASFMLVAAVTGCKSSNKSHTASNTTTAFPQSDWYTAAPEETTFQRESNPIYGEPVETEQPMQRAASTTLTAPATRYHTVAKKDTLYSLARQYYGSASKWKDIYKANLSTISDPNMILIGDRLVIP